MNTKHLVFDCRTSGLANRIRALLGFQSLANALGAEFWVHWAPDPGCNVHFCELFVAPPFKFVTEKQIDEFKAMPDAEVRTDLIWFDAIWKRYGSHRVARWDFFAKMRQSIGTLNPHPDIRQHIKEWSLANRPHECVALHVRNTDNLKFYERWARTRPGQFDIRHVSRLSGFARVAEKLQPEPVFLATDDPAVEKELRRILGDRLRTFPKAYDLSPQTETRRTTHVTTALTEMLILSSCRLIVGTYYSSFSKLSALLSNTPYLEVRGSRAVCNIPMEIVRRDLWEGRAPFWIRQLGRWYGDL